MAKKDIQLFEPTDRDVRVEYPELAQIEEFKKLTASEMLFAWAYACRTSKLNRLPEKDRIIKCLEILRKELNAEKIQQYSILDFPDHLKAALERMSKFDPGIRVQAKAIVETIFDNIKKIVEVKIDDITDMEEKKKYISLSIDVVKNMPEIVAQRENGYGIRTVEKKKASEISAAATNIWDSTSEGTAE